MAADLSALQQAVAADTNATTSAITLIQGLAAQIAALANAPTVDPAALQALSDSINAQASALANAVTANTPAAPATP